MAKTDFVNTADDGTKAVLEEYTYEYDSAANKWNAYNQGPVVVDLSTAATWNTVNGKNALEGPIYLSSMSSDPSPEGATPGTGAVVVPANSTAIMPANYWLWSDDTANPALIIDIPVTFTNSGNIIGKGGNGSTGTGGDGGPAITITATGVTVTNNANAFIAGGGGGGGGATTSGYTAGGGGGAGGGNGGNSNAILSGTITIGVGGSIGQTGTTGTDTENPENVGHGGGAGGGGGAAGPGGGGGRIISTDAAVAFGGASGDVASDTGTGNGGSAGNAGSNNNGNPWGGGGGGGWGAAGGRGHNGSSVGGNGGAGGAAITGNAYTQGTWDGTVYGSS